MPAETPEDDDRNEHSAEGEPWWADFVVAYGEVSLWELARRFGTNPRRLRRAAQRSGLSDETEAIRGALGRLGHEPDLALATSLGVSEDAISGARRRRAIAPFSSEPEPPPAPVAAAVPEPLQAPRTPPRPRRNRRFDPPAAVVVVRKGSRAQLVDPHARAPLATVPKQVQAPQSLPPRERPEVSSERTRRRIVKSDDRPEAPEPEAPAPRPRRGISAKPPVRIVFDRKTATGELPTGAPTAEAPPSQPTPAQAAAVIAAAPAPVAAEPAPAPVVAVAEAPVVAAPTPAPDPAPVAAAEPILVDAPPSPAPAAAFPAGSAPADTAHGLWTARVETGTGAQDIYILAANLVSAAHRAAAEGTVLSLSAVSTL